MSLLKPGAAVFVIALKKPDGTVTAARLYAEKDGIKPPMAEFLREQLAPVGRVTMRRGRPEGFAQADMGIRQVA